MAGVLPASILSALNLGDEVSERLQNEAFEGEGHSAREHADLSAPHARAERMQEPFPIGCDNTSGSLERKLDRAVEPEPMSKYTKVLHFWGRVTRRHWYSSKMFFFDLEGPEDPSPHQAASLLEPSTIDLSTLLEGSQSRKLLCCYRKGAEHHNFKTLTAANVVSLADEVLAGDVVSITFAEGDLEGLRSVEVLNLSTLSRWTDTNPGETYPEDEIEPPTPTDAPVTATKMNRQPRGELCKFWLNSGRCPLKQCTLKHVHGEERTRARVEWQLARREQKAETSRKQALSVGDGVANHDKKHKKFRAEIFCQWLLNSVGIEKLAAGTGVLDIAGGRGEITKKLKELGVPCTVIDPRDPNLVKGRKVDHDQITRCFDEALWEDEKFKSLLQGCSLLVGMHPDQATEPIVDYALAHQKPFAVVPCCVFARTKGLHRRTNSSIEDADLVITYEDFLRYLGSKHSLIGRTCLAFQGRNVILHIFDYSALAATTREGTTG